MNPLDLSTILKGLQGKWVALSDDVKKIYGSGDSAKSAADDAKSKGYKEFTLLFVDPSDLLYCG